MRLSAASERCESRLGAVVALRHTVLVRTWLRSYAMTVLCRRLLCRTLRHCVMQRW